MKKKITSTFILFALILVTIYAATSKVYVTPNGKKYHERTCRTLARSKQIIELSVEDAVAKNMSLAKSVIPTQGNFKK